MEVAEEGFKSEEELRTRGGVFGYWARVRIVSGLVQSGAGSVSCSNAKNYVNSCGLGMVLRFSGRELAEFQVWKGLDLEEIFHLMLIFWHIYLSVCSLRGLVSAGRIICLSGTVRLGGDHYGVYFFRDFGGIWVAESVGEIFGGFEGKRTDFLHPKASFK